MERRPTSIRTTLAVSVLALTLIAPWAVGQDLTETRRLAEQGTVSAQFDLGVHYANGEGVPENDAEAVNWYRLAAEQGYAPAQYNLGVMYDEGRGVREDAAEAARWFRLAAEQGDATAQYNLGVMYREGRGALKDFVLAHMWYNIAAANGNEMAREARDNLERGSGFFRSEQDLTRDEIRRATELARTCMASDYQDCQP